MRTRNAVPPSTPLAQVETQRVRSYSRTQQRVPSPCSAALLHPKAACLCACEVFSGTSSPAPSRQQKKCNQRTCTACASRRGGVEDGHETISAEWATRADRKVRRCCGAASGAHTQNTPSQPTAASSHVLRQRHRSCLYRCEAPPRWTAGAPPPVPVPTPPRAASREQRRRRT